MKFIKSTSIPCIFCNGTVSSPHGHHCFGMCSNSTGKIELVLQAKAMSQTQNSLQDFNKLLTAYNITNITQQYASKAMGYMNTLKPMRPAIIQYKKDSNMTAIH